MAARPASAGVGGRKPPAEVGYLSATPAILVIERFAQFEKIAELLLEQYPAEEDTVNEISTGFDEAVPELAGVHAEYRIGGAQAIAGMAFGTETVPRVDTIVGPGNVWVTAAKREAVAHLCSAFDMSERRARAGS